MAHAREIEEDELSRHPPGERLEELDVAADAVEEEERKAGLRAGFAADAQQLRAGVHHFDRKRARRSGRGLWLRGHPQTGPPMATRAGLCAGSCPPPIWAAPPGSAPAWAPCTPPVPARSAPSRPPR